MPDVVTTAIGGLDYRGYQRGASASNGTDQYVVPVNDRITTFAGRVTTFITPGRGGAIGADHKIIALHNATGSTVLVNINRITVDLLTTVVKAVTVIPPVIRLQRFTAVPTGGTALTKVGFNTTQTSSSSVTAWGDSSADNSGAGTSSGTQLTITAGGVISQVWAPRMLSAVGYETVDFAPFMYGSADIVLNALEGVCINLGGGFQATTVDPTTDKWIAEIDFEEYTRP